MNKQLSLLVILAIALSSCVVSKKKYDALMADRNQLSDQLDSEKATNKTLEGNLNNAISDFNSLKNDFGKSNALRSDQIADLLIQVTALKDKSDSLNTKLTETVSKFKAKERDNYMAEEELKDAATVLAALKRDTASLNYSLNMAKERNSNLQNELQASKEKANLAAQGQYAKEKEIEVQQNKLKEAERQLIKSQQNISEISNAFIELRKELLSAKSNNTVIDPNKSATINKIAKLLGHY